MGGWAGTLAGALLVVGFCAVAQAQDINRTSLSGEAIEGYDPVAYFSAGQPQPGSRAFLYEWQGAVWRFASTTDRDAFATDPQRYAPAFGGYCAYAMSKGLKADIHPYAFAIVAGRLYLFATFESRDRFLANSEIRHGAEENWAQLSTEVF